jgi:hypothetical protein
VSIPNDLLAQIENENPKLGIFLRQYVLPTISRTAQNAAVDQTSQIHPPDPPESVKVTTAGEMMQVVVNHTAPLIRGAHYIYTVGTNSSQLNAQVECKPATRSPLHFTLPTFQADGTTKHNYYVSVQVQYPGGPPSRPTHFGGSSPSPITLAGTTAMDIQPGTGSGTARNGASALQGLGTAPIRR